MSNGDLFLYCYVIAAFAYAYYGECVLMPKQEKEREEIWKKYLDREKGNE